MKSCTFESVLSEKSKIITNDREISSIMKNYFTENNFTLKSRTRRI